MKGFKNYLKSKADKAKDMLSNPEKYKSEFIRDLRDFEMLSRHYSNAFSKYYKAKEAGDVENQKKYEKIYKTMLDRMQKANDQFMEKYSDAKQFTLNIPGVDAETNRLTNYHLSGLIGFNNGLPKESPEEAFKKWFGIK